MGVPRAGGLMIGVGTRGGKGLMIGDGRGDGDGVALGVLAGLEVLPVLVVPLPAAGGGGGWVAIGLKPALASPGENCPGKPPLVRSSAPGLNLARRSIARTAEGNSA